MTATSPEQITDLIREFEQAIENPDEFFASRGFDQFVVSGMARIFARGVDAEAEELDRESVIVVGWVAGFAFALFAADQLKAA